MPTESTRSKDADCDPYRRDKGGADAGVCHTLTLAGSGRSHSGLFGTDRLLHAG